jgi:hypothetical protein
MNTLKTFGRLLFLLFSTGIALFLFSCDNEGADPPVITKVRVVGKPDTSFVAIAAGKMIVIEGRNLNGVKQVLFNNFNAPFNSNYVTGHSIIVTIPEDAPTEVTEPDAPNKVKVVTGGGTAEFDFTLLPTPPQIAVVNEFTKPGDEMILYGSNIFLVEKITLPGGIEVTDYVIDEDGTTVTFILPESATEPGPIMVKTKYTTVETPPINDNTGMIVNFDDIGTLEWGCSESNDDVNFPGARGDFALMSFGAIPADNSSWWEGGRSVNTPGNTVWLPQDELSGSIDDYAVKFEIFIKTPWKYGTLLAMRSYGFQYIARVAPWRGSPDKTAKTDQWVTVTLPLSMFKTKANDIDGTGEPAPSLAALLGDGTGNFNLFYVNDKAYSTGTQDGFSTGIDNIRLVKIQ